MLFHGTTWLEVELGRMLVQRLLKHLGFMRVNTWAAISNALSPVLKIQVSTKVMPITLNQFLLANQLFLLPQARRLPPSRPKVVISAFSSSSQMGKHSLEDILPAIRSVVPPLTPDRHKGQAGKIAVIGGCREYTGAPYFSAISALKIGADLSHVFCTRGAATVIKSYSPELIVHPIFLESHDIGETEQEKEAVKSKALAELTKWLSRSNCLVVGPGLGRDPLVLDCVSEIIRKARASNIPVVLDGDGLSLVTDDPGLISGYALATLTPNLNEHKRLSEKIKGSDHEVQPDKIPEELKALASRLGGVTIIQKGSTDYISDGTSVLASDFFGAPRRCGDQGDILSGCVAVFTSWAREFLAQDEHSTEAKAVERLTKNPAMIGALAGSIIVRKAIQDAFARHRRSTVTSTIIECLEASMDELCPL